ncbi:MAG: xylulokinase [Candidatus Limnocylindrales bacterium]
MSARLEPLILAIDLGTTEVKSGLFTTDGRLVGLARAGYPTIRTGAGVAEQDPGSWWAAIGRTTHELRRDERAGILAICCVGQGPTLVPTDAAGIATGPAVAWLDTRSAAEVGELAALTGRFSWELGVLPAALHLERHDPEALGAVRWYLNAWEAIACRMTGVAAETRLAGQLRADPGDVAGSGIRVDRLPPVIASGRLLGSLLGGPAEDLGLPAGTPVVAGMVDAYASFFGAGLLESGDAVDTGGTSGGFAVYADRALAIPGSFCAPAPVEGLWVLGGAMNATGKALDWLAGIVDGSAGIDALLAEAARVPPGSAGLVFLPYLAGERSPIWDPDARGAFVGLTLEHTRGHLVRAVVEAAAFALRHVMGPIVDAGANVHELRVSGGPAQSLAWNQLKADITGLVVAVPKVAETAVLGAAVACAAGMAVYPDLVAATRAMVAIERRLLPDPDNRAIYDEVFGAYLGLYPALSGTFHRLAAIAT